MTSEPPPSSSPPPPRFRSKVRGYDNVEVDRTISDLLAEQKRLTEERASLQARLDALGESDLTAELTAVSKDTADILEAAKRAAAGMRDRAAADAARWRQEATEAASGSIEQAAADAETMRRSAWDIGTQLLADADAEMAGQRSELERETVDRRAVSEREAHQHLANARSEAEAIVSRARTTAEEALEEARRRHDEIGEQIRSSIEQAEGKVRGLEERRAELTAEAEKAEADLQALDDEIAARRQRLEVVDLEIPGEIGAGERLGFRLIPVQSHAEEPPSAITEEQRQVDALTMADEVRRLRRQSDHSPETAAAEETTPAAHTPPSETQAVSPLEPAPPEEAAKEHPPVEAAPASTEEEEPEAIPETAVAGPGPVPAEASESIAGLPGRDDLAPLFAALRVPGPAAEDEPASSSERVKSPVTTHTAEIAAEDRAALELRDQLLLPITNRVLRDLKRQLTEAQNLALEQLRLSNDPWLPDTEDLEARLHPDLTVLAQEAFGAGHVGAVSLAGIEATRPRPHPEDLPDPTVQLASDLAAELAVASGDGRQASSAISRVYRQWRTDEVERRVRTQAIAAYHRGLRRALLEANPESVLRVVPSGRIRPECAAAAAAGPFPADGAVPGLGDLPPIAVDCGCTVVPAG